MATSISINTTDTEYGTKKQKSVSYIDPNASNTALISFAQGMVSLMADTSYESTTRIDKTECDEIKPQFFTTIVMGIWSTTENKRKWVNIINMTETIEVPFLSAAENNIVTLQMYNSSVEASGAMRVEPRITTSSSNWLMSAINHITNNTNGNAFVVDLKCTTQQEETFTMTINLPRTTNFAEFNKTYTIHFYDSSNMQNQRFNRDYSELKVGD